MGSLQFPNMGMGLRLAAFGRRSSAIKISFSNFDAVLHILFGIFLTVIDKLNESNSCEIPGLHINSLSNRRCHKRCCRCCLKCHLLLRRRESVCTFDHQYFCSVVLCLGVCLFCTRLSTHFSAVHSVVIACAVDICLLF